MSQCFILIKGSKTWRANYLLNHFVCLPNKDVFFCSLDPPVQDPVLLAEPLPVSPVLLRQQPAWWIFRGAPQLQLPIRTQPLSVAAALLCGGRISLCRVRVGQPHPLWELQSGFCPHTGGLQAHGGWLHGELPGIRDRPPGFGVGLPVTESWPQARGRLFFLIFVKYNLWFWNEPSSIA